jgi:hypothetical protein
VPGWIHVQLKTGAKKAEVIDIVWQQLVDFSGTDATRDTEPLQVWKHPELHAEDVDLGSLLRPTVHTVAGACKGDATWMSAALINVANHWCGDCSMCAKYWGADAPCQKHPELHKRYYAVGGKTHKAVLEWLTKRFSVKNCEDLRFADENYLVETYHRALLKWCPKTIHYPKSHRARILMAAMDWNENAVGRPIVSVKPRAKVSSNCFRTRSGTNRVLAPKTREWKRLIAHHMGIPF